MLNAIKFYSNKYNYMNFDITIINIGENIGWYTTFFGILNYSIISFEPFPEKNYILNKNFCRNFLGSKSSITIVNEVLHPKEAYCYYYKDLYNDEKKIIFCDDNKEKKIGEYLVKVGTIKANKLINFIPVINEKKIVLLNIDLDYEGEMAVESGKELIYKYHVPYIFIKFNMFIFTIHETRPEEFLNFFNENGYKISLNGFLTNECISIESLLKAEIVKFNLYLIYIGK